MSAGSPATLIPLSPFPVSAHPIPSGRFLCEAHWTCRSGPGYTWRQRCDCLVSTGELYSVVPPRIRHQIDLIDTPEPAWVGDGPEWYGVPCRVARVELWLQTAAGGLRSFDLLALLPRREAPDAPPYIHLGMQFFLEYAIEVTLRCSSPVSTSSGDLYIP